MGCIDRIKFRKYWLVCRWGVFWMIFDDLGIGLRIGNGTDAHPDWQEIEQIFVNKGVLYDIIV